MKINYFLTKLFILLLFTNLLNAQNVFVPDDNFEQALIDLGYDTGKLNDSVLLSSVINIKYLDINNRNITDLTGIEHFIMLEQLSCSSNNIKTLDLSLNTNLEHLACEDNKMTFLNLSNSLGLQYLYCRKNNLTSLDLSMNSNLISLDCTENQLSKLNIQNGQNNKMQMHAKYNPDLQCIQVDDPDASYSNDYSWDKDPTSGYSTDCTIYKSEMIFIPDDNFEQALIDFGWDVDTILNDSVPASAIIGISTLNIYNRNITDLTGIANFKFLKYLNCGGNQITELDVSENEELSSLYCQSNKINTLDLSKNSNLHQLDCSFNLLTNLNLKNGSNSVMYLNAINNPNLICIQVDDPSSSYNNPNWSKNGYAAYTEDCLTYDVRMAYVPDDNFEKFLITTSYDFGELNDSVPIAGIEQIRTLDISYQEIHDITGIENFVKLDKLNLRGNYLNYLDISSNIDLKEINFKLNKIKEIDLSSNINLKVLDCSENEIELIDLHLNQKLETLVCSNNFLTKLELASNKFLIKLDCSFNEIISLDLKTNSQLKFLICPKNLLTSLDLTSNDSLTFIHCGYNKLKLLNLKNGFNHKLTNMNCSYNQLNCIQVDDPEISLTKIDWVKDDSASYSFDCNMFPVESIEIKKHIFDIFPNPSHSRIFIQTGNTPVKLEIFNSAGSMIYSKDSFISSWVEIEKYDPGVYIFRITGENSGPVINKKVVVEKQK